MHTHGGRVGLVPLAVFVLALGAVPAAAGDAATAEEDIVIPTQIALASVGDWAEYRLADGKRSRLTVVEKWEEYGETFVSIQNEISNAKRRRLKVVEEKVCVPEAVADLQALGPEDRVSTSEILLHGRRLKVVVVSYVEEGEVVRQSYFSDKVPVYGLVRGVEPGKKERIALTLLDYGYADE